MEKLNELDYVGIARSMMADIQNDCGSANRFNGGFEYPEEWVEKIAEHWESFVKKNPTIFQESNMDDIEEFARCFALGDEEWGMAYESYPGYAELSEVLEEYFETL